MRTAAQGVPLPVKNPARKFQRVFATRQTAPDRARPQAGDPDVQTRADAGAKRMTQAQRDIA